MTGHRSREDHQCSRIVQSTVQSWRRKWFVWDARSWRLYQTASGQGRPYSKTWGSISVHQGQLSKHVRPKLTWLLSTNVYLWLLNLISMVVCVLIVYCLCNSFSLHQISDTLLIFPSKFRILFFYDVYFTFSFIFHFYITLHQFHSPT